MNLLMNEYKLSKPIALWLGTNVINNPNHASDNGKYLYKAFTTHVYNLEHIVYVVFTHILFNICK